MRPMRLSPSEPRLVDWDRPSGGPAVKIPALSGIGVGDTCFVSSQRQERNAAVGFL